MSPRAAWRLESLGFGPVYEYAAGKQDWLAAGLPTEGEKADEPRAGGVARDDVPICRLDETLGAINERLRGTEWDTCIVVNESRVVFGIMRPEQLGGERGQTAEQAMRPGPSTFRPHVEIVALARHMQEHDLASAPITTGDGVLVGLLLSSDAERAAEAIHGESHGHRDR